MRNELEKKNLDLNGLKFLDEKSNFNSGNNILFYIYILRHCHENVSLYSTLLYYDKQSQRIHVFVHGLSSLSVAGAGYKEKELGQVDILSKMAQNVCTGVVE